MNGAVENVHALAPAVPPSYPAPEVYEPRRQEEPSGCRETLVLTRAVFAVLLPPLLAVAGVLASLVAAIVLFALHPALALLPIAALLVAVLLFARWERRHIRPPDV